MVVPNLGGISVWSPRLDSVGNSVRGIAVAKALVE
jgi:glutaminase